MSLPSDEITAPKDPAEYRPRPLMGATYWAMMALMLLCVLADKDGDKIFSTFDTRDFDTSQPDMACGTHIITGGTGKYKGITGSEPFACNSLPALAGEGGYTSMDIPHNTTWEIKGE